MKTVHILEMWEVRIRRTTDPLLFSRTFVGGEELINTPVWKCNTSYQFAPLWHHLTRPLVNTRHRTKQTELQLMD